MLLLGRDGRGYLLTHGNCSTDDEKLKIDLLHAFAQKVLKSPVISLRSSAYLCDLCDKGAISTQRSQRYAETAEKGIQIRGVFRLFVQCVATLRISQRLTGVCRATVATE